MKKTTLLFKIFTVFLINFLLITCLTTSAAILSDIPPEMGKYQKGWPSSNRDYTNNRATFDSSINAENVSNLGIKWQFDILGVGEWGAAATNPLIVENTVYLQDLKSNLYALDFSSGKLLWKKEYNLDAYGPCGPALGWNKIFVQKGHYEVAALDLKGKELWSTKLSDRETVGIDIQLCAYGNLIYISTVPGTSNADFYTGGGVGIIYALEQETGNIKWSFNTVDSRDIWGNPQVNSGGGAWYPPAIDTNTGMMYWGIANPAPWPGTKDFPNGSSRPGPNLYTNSLVALDANAGTLKWYNQVLPHDIFDLDLQLSPLLCTLEIEGKNKEIVIGSGKLGKVFLFDRNTAEIIWQTPVGKHLNDDLKELPEGTNRVYPGPLGGVETPMAFADGILYVPIVNLFGDYTPGEFIGSTFDIGAGTGEITAIDLKNRKILWDKEFNSINIGAATVVNDLVFTSTFDGMIYALDRNTGEELWKYQANGNINGWPAVAKDTIIFPIGLGQTPKLLAFTVGEKVNVSTTIASAVNSPGEVPSSTNISFKADGLITPGEYLNSQIYGDYEVYWTNDEQYIYLALKAKTTGFVAMALQPGEKMKNADMFFGFVKDGKAEMYDLFSTGTFGPHPTDIELGGTNDILEFAGTESDGSTILELKRALKTPDKYDLEIQKGANKIIWSYGDSDSLDVKHRVRGYGEIIIK
jgi:outer membrane protein assembly factor BamB